MHLVHADKNCEMWNFAIEEHLTLDNCFKPKFQPAEEKKKRSCCGTVIAVCELQPCYAAV